MDRKKDDDYRPENLTRGERISRFIWNSRTKEFLGRTAKSWLQITVFYIVLYSFLAAFFSALLIIFFQTVDNHQPKWKLDESLIGTSPGLGYRPMNPNAEITFISYTPSDQDSVDFWTEVIDDFLKPYDDAADTISCDYGSQLNENTTCRFEVKLGACKDNQYGFKDNKPCMFFKLNKIFNWEPEPYQQSEIQDNAMGMPEKLREKILKMDVQAGSSNVWASCEAAEPHANVTLEYDGHPGFPNYYFPFLNQKKYQSPLVVLQINNMPTGALVRINCRLWAKNISYDKQRRTGGATFEIQSN